MVGLMPDSWFFWLYPSLSYAQHASHMKSIGIVLHFRCNSIWWNAMYMYISRTKNLLLSQHGTPVQQEKQWHPYDVIKYTPKEKTGFCFQNEVVLLNRIKPNYRTACSVPKTCTLNYLPSPQSAPWERGMKRQCGAGSGCGQTAMLILQGTWRPCLGFLFPSTTPNLHLGFLKLSQRLL